MTKGEMKKGEFMASGEINPLSALDRLDALASNFNTAMQKSHGKITDLSVRSIADPASAFQKRPRFLVRVARWVARYVFHKEALFTVSGVPLKVRMYDTPSNVREIRHLFRIALQEVNHLTEFSDKERMLRVVQFALHCDQLVPPNRPEESSHMLLRKFLMGGVGEEAIQKLVQSKEVSSEAPVGQTIVECARQLNTEHSLRLENLFTLFSVVEEVLTEKQRQDLAIIIADILRQQMDQQKDLGDLIVAWEKDSQMLKTSDPIFFSTAIAKGGGALVDNVERCVKQGKAELVQLTSFYATIERKLSGVDRERLVAQISKVFQKELAHVQDLNGLISFWEKSRVNFTEAAVSFSSEDLKNSCDIILQRLKVLLQEDGDVAKLHKLFGILHPVASSAQARQFAMMTATLICAEAQKGQNPQEILSLWKEKMVQMKNGGTSIPFQAQDFAPIVLCLTESWKQICEEASSALGEASDFEAFQQAAGKEASLLQEKIRAQEQVIEEVVRACPLQMREQIEGFLESAMGGSLVSLYQIVQQKLLQLVLPSIERLKSREELLASTVALHAFRRSLEVFSSQSLRALSTRRMNEECLKMIEGALDRVEEKIRLLPSSPPKTEATTTHILSHNVINISSVGQSAMMNALSMYAAPALIRSFGVAGAAASIGLTLAAPTLISVGTSIIAPVGTFIDKQCDRLPSTIKTPMKYLWRIGLTAAALYSAYSAYQRWCTTSVVPMQPSLPSFQNKTEAQSSALPLTAPQPTDTTAKVTSLREDRERMPDIQRQYEEAVASDIPQSMKRPVPSQPLLEAQLSENVTKSLLPSLASQPQETISIWSRIKAAFFRGQEGMRQSRSILPPLKGGEVTAGGSIEQSHLSSISSGSIGRGRVSEPMAKQMNQGLPGHNVIKL
jgi:hypothetical protein